MDLKTHIGLRVKSARNRAGLTQAKLAEKLDRAIETVSNIERGQSLPGLEMLAAISEITSTPMGYYLEGFDRPRRVSASRLRVEQAMLDTMIALSDEQLELALRLVRSIRE